MQEHTSAQRVQFAPSFLSSPYGTSPSAPAPFSPSTVARRTILPSTPWTVSSSRLRTRSTRCLQKRPSKRLLRPSLPQRRRVALASSSAKIAARKAETSLLEERLSGAFIRICECQDYCGVSYSRGLQDVVTLPAKQEALVKQRDQLLEGGRRELAQMLDRISDRDALFAASESALRSEDTAE